MTSMSNMQTTILKLQQNPFIFRTQGECTVCGEIHINFAIPYQGTRVEWHNCIRHEGWDSPLETCCSCHNEQFPNWAGGAAYFGSENSDSEDMEFLANAMVKNA